MVEHDSIAQRPLSSLSGCLYTAHGAYLILGGFVLAVFCWLIPALLIKVTRSDVVDPDQLPRIARLVLEQRQLLPLLALPVIVFGLIVVNRVRFRALWVVLGLVWMLLPAVLLIFTFVVTIGLLYQPQEL